VELAISRGSDDVVTAWLDDELDAATAPRLAQLLSLVVLRGSRVVLDMSRVTFMDCAGLGEIVRAHRRAVEGGGWVRLAFVPDGPLLVLQLTGSAHLLTARGLPEQRAAE
jgi:anti-sigma B factor antagonist